MVKEILLKTTIPREKGYRYYIAKGDLCTLARTKFERGSKEEILLKTTIKKDKSNYLYFVDKGDMCVLARAKMERGKKKKQ